MFPTIRSALWSAALGALVMPSLRAQDDGAEQDDFDRTPEECITLSRIDRTDVIDGRTIVFYAGRRQVYRNYLPRECPGLERQKRFMYEVRGNRLCDIDQITVLEQFGSRLERGFTCRLGQFHPISEDEVEELKLLADRKRDSDAVDVEAVELPDEPTRENGESEGDADAEAQSEAENRDR